MTITRPMLTVADAAAHCGVTTKTIQRRLPQLEDLGAVKDAAGKWTIPYEALLGVGLKPGKPAGPDRVDSPTDTPSVSKENVLADVRADVRAEMDSLRHRAVLAEELLAAERRINRALEDALELAKRQLLPGALDQPAPAIVTEPAADLVNDDLEVITEPAEDISTEPAEIVPALTDVQNSRTTEPKKPALRARFAGIFRRK